MSDWVKNTIMFPVSDEMLLDSGIVGPRFRTIPDRGRWADAWQAAQPRDPWSFIFRQCPPWENWDKPALATITLWPRTEAALARLAAASASIRKQRRLIRDRLIGARDGWMLRSDDDD